MDTVDDSGPPARPGPDRTPGRHDVAIIGMACVMPGAADLESFWANIVDAVDSIAEVDPGRWNPELHYDPEGRHARSVSKWGGWIPDVGFDALAWGIPPASLASIDPAQLLALKTAADALADAGYGTSDDGRAFDRELASVIYATGSGGASELPAGFLLRVLLQSHRAGTLPPDLDAYLPDLTEDGLPGILTSVIAGRVANRLDLGGKNLTVDSACASVLAGLDIACTELTGGGSDLVLCGGVDLHNSATDFISFTAAGALSPTGRCRSFDAAADGMTLAEGAGCIVLKRRTDAERDGDRIYAVIRGVAGSSDGRHLGITAPRQEGQVKAVRRAYEAAGIAPADVGLVEAHGTGTSAGDRTELRTMTQTFTEGGATPGSVVMGSVKSNIGHIKCAAGIASLIKAAKATYHGVLPATLHITRPTEEWDPAASPFVFSGQSRPWTRYRRIAGVSGFGFGGTNFHAVLENHQALRSAGRPVPVDLRSGRPRWPAELFAFRADDAAELAARLAELGERLDTELTDPRPADRTRLQDVAAAVSASGDGPVRLAVVAHDLDDLAGKLRAAGTDRMYDGVYHRAPAADDAGTGPVPVTALRTDDTHTSRTAIADLLVAFPDLRHPEVLSSRELPYLSLVTELFPGVVGGTVDDRNATGDTPPGHRSAPTTGPDPRHGIVSLLHALARLAAAGVPVPLDTLHIGRGSRPHAWTDPGPRPGWIVNGHCARTAAGEPLLRGLRPADQAPTVHLADAPGRDRADAVGDTDLAARAAVQAAVANDYLRTVHEILTAGSDILRAGLDPQLHPTPAATGSADGAGNGSADGDRH